MLQVPRLPVFPLHIARLLAFPSLLGRQCILQLLHVRLYPLHIRLQVLPPRQLNPLLTLARTTHKHVFRQNLVADAVLVKHVVVHPRTRQRRAEQEPRQPVPNISSLPRDNTQCSWHGVPGTRRTRCGRRPRASSRARPARPPGGGRRRRAAGSARAVGARSGGGGGGGVARPWVLRGWRGGDGVFWFD
jgi:hypothetical protein